MKNLWKCILRVYWRLSFVCVCVCVCVCVSPRWNDQLSQQKNYKNVANIFKVNIKGTRLMSAASIINFKNILPFIILLILLFLLLYYCWFAGWTWHSKISDNKLLPVAARNVVSYGLEKFVGLHVFILVHQT